MTSTLAQLQYNPDDPEDPIVVKEGRTVGRAEDLRRPAPLGSSADLVSPQNPATDVPLVPDFRSRDLLGEISQLTRDAVAPPEAPASHRTRLLSSTSTRRIRPRRTRSLRFSSRFRTSRRCRQCPIRRQRRVSRPSRRSVTSGLPAMACVPPER